MYILRRRRRRRIGRRGLLSIYEAAEMRKERGNVAVKKYMCFVVASRLGGLVGQWNNNWELTTYKRIHWIIIYTEKRADERVLKPFFPFRLPPLSSVREIEGGMMIPYSYTVFLVRTETAVARKVSSSSFSHSSEDNIPWTCCLILS